MIRPDFAKLERKLGKNATALDVQRWHMLRAMAWRLQMVAVHAENERRARARRGRA